MSISQKYGRTYHYPFSPGTTSDDRIMQTIGNNFKKYPNLYIRKSSTVKITAYQNTVYLPGLMRRLQYLHGLQV